MAAAALTTCRILLMLLANTAFAQAQGIPPPAYQVAAQRAGIPAVVLYAVALQESGMTIKGRLMPWPWSLNVAGHTRRYATRAQACADLKQSLREWPPTRIDVGLGQINLGHQKDRYNRPCDLLNPYVNLRIAASILREHHTPGDDWLIAIGRYHRPAGGEPAARYRRHVSRHLTHLQQPSQPDPFLE